MIRTARLAAMIPVIAAVTVTAGPLDPPPGPVTPTQKTLAEAEPRVAINDTNTPGDADSRFKITQPGSYYLTGNITDIAGEHGIEITVSGVTLDLNGFDLVGVPDTGDFDGISATVNDLIAIAVFNGSVRNWSNEGIDFGTRSAQGCRIERIRSSGNGGIGVRAGDGSAVIGCTAFQNGSHGISIGSGSMAAHCASYENNVGFNSGSGSALADCAAYQNINNGFSITSGGTITSCTAFDNGGFGVNAGTGSTVSGCSASQNGLSGIFATNSGTVVHCTARGNISDGIVCGSSCLVRDNACSSNGNGGDGAGIHAQGVDNRIEGNTCTSADRGIDVDATGNIVIRNSCSGNLTNWVIVAGNALGPIVVTSAGAAVNGNTAASSLGSADPNANFTY